MLNSAWLPSVNEELIPATYLDPHNSNKDN